MPQQRVFSNTGRGIRPRSPQTNLVPRHSTSKKEKRDAPARRSAQDVNTGTRSARPRRTATTRVTTLRDLDLRVDTVDEPLATTTPPGAKLHFSVYRGQTLFEPHCWEAPNSTDVPAPLPTTTSTQPPHTTAEPAASHAATAAQVGVEPAVIEALFAAAPSSKQTQRIVRSTQRPTTQQRPLERTLHVPDPHVLGRLHSNHGGYRRRTGPSAIAVSQLMAARNHRLLTREEEAALVGLVHAGLVEGASPETIARGDEARQTLVAHNVRLVLSLAGGFRRKLGGAGAHVSMDDLVAAGVEGLVKGIDRFDLTRGVKLATYCYYHILSCMIDLLCELGRPFQVPRSVVDQLATLERAERAFAERHGRLASPEELQAATKLPVKAMPKLLNMRALVPVALDASALGDDASDLHCRLVDPSTRPWTALAEARLRDETVASLVQGLPAREAMALQLVYGLASGNPMPYKEAAKVMGLSKQRVGQLVKAALQRLRMRFQQLRSSDGSGEWTAVLETVVMAT